MREQMHQDWIDSRVVELEHRPFWIGKGNIRRLAHIQLADALQAGYDVTLPPWRMRLWQEFAALDAGYELIV